jgi:predicted phage terminase large subunit-like protein
MSLLNVRVTEEALIASITRDSFVEFVKTFWDTVVAEPLVWNWHMTVLCDQMQRRAERVFDGLPKETDLVINVPPGTSKSTICSVMFPAWTWTRMPHAKHICGSYSYPLAMALSQKSRDVVLSDKYRACFPGVELREDQNAKGNFATSAKGMRYAVGVNGSVLGMHAHFIIIDDPLDPEQAASELELARANRWLRETLPTRKVDKAVSVTTLIMQRLHQDDPTALFLARPGVEHVCMPATLSPRVRPRTLRALYRSDKPGEDGLLDPRRLSNKVLEEARQTLGEYGYASQFDQAPVPAGGGMFKTDRVQHLAVPAGHEFVKRVRFWDKAGTQGGVGAYTAGVLMARDRDGYFWVLDVVRDRVDSGARERLILETAKKDGYGVEVGVEQTGNEGGKQSAEQTVRMLAGFRVRVWKVGKSDGDKIDRADPYSVQVNNGNVRVKKLAPWVKAYLDELQHFPLSRYKDQVDASAGAFHLLSKARSRIGAWSCS